MHNPDHEAMARRAHQAELALAVFSGLGIALLAVYALGASGLPGEAFMAVIDWAVGRGLIPADGPVLQAGLTAALG